MYIYYCDKYSIDVFSNCRMTVVLTRHVSDLATRFTDKLNALPTDNKEQINTYITNVFLEVNYVTIVENINHFNNLFDSVIFYNHIITILRLSITHASPPMYMLPTITRPPEQIPIAPDCTRLQIN